MAAYDIILNEYRSVFTKGKDAWQYQEQYSDVSGLVFIYTEDDKYNYTYYDIDKNGIQELLVSDSWGTIIDVYAYDGVEAVKLITDTHTNYAFLGERAHLKIYTDGTLHIQGSGGAAYGSDDFYQISENGYVLRLVESYTFNDADYSQNPYSNGSERFTSAEFREILSRYIEVTNFEWKPFTTNGSSEMEPIDLFGTWDSENGKYRITFEPTTTAISISIANGMTTATGNCIIVDKKNAEVRYGAYNIDNNNEMTFFINLNKYTATYSYALDNLAIEGEAYHKIDSAILNQLIGIWENNGISMVFDDNTYKINQDGKDTISGNYFVINSNTVLVIRKELYSTSAYETEYNISGNCLTFNGLTGYKNGPDSSAETVIGVRNALCGTWAASNYEAYTFYDDNTYSLDIIRIASDGTISIIVNTGSGTYEVVNEETIRIYQEGTKDFYSDYEYDAEAKTLSQGILSTIYTKVY